MPERTELTVRVTDSIAEVPAVAWNACAGLSNPFVSHAFLHALETSGSVGGKSGWEPRHLLVEDRNGRLLASAPVYLKSHSYGEYVFDWSWADAWQRAGRAYYPKLQCAVPFTPVTGRRLLVHPDAAGLGLEAALAGAMETLANSAGLSSAHVTFATEAEARALAGAGWLLRIGEQYHWHNRDYRDFDDFLDALASRKRKAIRKERMEANAQGLDIACLVGKDITPRHWDAFFRFYRSTVDRHWGQAYLNRAFFHSLGEVLGDKLLLVVAERAGRPVAGALNVIGTDRLFGRNWGADVDVRFLHFELCYYRAIDFAIARGLSVVEAGAQGEHKISRGYEPIATYSAHWLREAPLRRAVAAFLTEERQAMRQHLCTLAETGPFRQDGGETRSPPGTTGHHEG